MNGYGYSLVFVVDMFLCGKQAHLNSEIEMTRNLIL